MYQAASVDRATARRLGRSLTHRAWLQTVLIAAMATTAGGMEAAPQDSVAVAPEPAANSSAPGNSDGILSLADAVALALTNSPELAPFAWEERVSEARVLQAGLRPNPELNLQVEDVLGTGDFSGGSHAQTTLQLGQVIELGAKRRARKSVASQSRDHTQAQYELKRVDVLADVTRRFIQVVSGQQSLELAITNRDLAQDALRIVQERVRAGRSSALDEINAQLALARGESLVETARHELSAARKLLSASWRETEPTFERVDADLFARRAAPTYEELLLQLSASPHIALSLSEERLREAEVRLGEARKAPNLTLFGGVRRLESSNDEALVAGVSMPLQIFDRNQGGVAEARAALGLSQAERDATEFRLGVVLLGLYEEAIHELHVMESLETEILPRAERARTISGEGYAQGRFSYLEVLDAQRTVFDVRREYIATATSYHALLVEIERLTGRSFDAGESPK